MISRAGLAGPAANKYLFTYHQLYVCAISLLGKTICFLYLFNLLEYLITYFSEFKLKMPWNYGAWWPIYVPQWWSPIVSRHPLDPYSFVHLQTGVICFYVCGFPLWYFLGEEYRS